MKPLKFYQTGSLEHLKIVEADGPIPQLGEVVVRVNAAAINPSDVKKMSLEKYTAQRFLESPDSILPESSFLIPNGKGNLFLEKRT